MLIAMLLTYITAILFTTLVFRTPADEPRAEWLPFWSWYEVIAHHDMGLFVEIVLNIALFVPVGGLMRMLGIRWRTVVLFSLVFSASIELMQYVLCRGLCELWDDVVDNTLGSVVGYVLIRAAERYRRGRTFRGQENNI